MKLRLETLKRDQERMIKEMERAIYKREAIALRHRGQKTEELTQHQLRKQLRSLRSTIKKTVGETAEYEAAVKEKVDEMEQVGKELEKASNDYGRLEEDANELQNTINDALYEKQRNLDGITKKQRMIQRYRDLSEGRFPYEITGDSGPAYRTELNAKIASVQTCRR